MMEARKEVMVTVEMGGDDAVRLSGSLNRVLNAVGELDNDALRPLINAGDIDRLLSLRLLIDNTLDR